MAHKRLKRSKSTKPSTASKKRAIKPTGAVKFDSGKPQLGLISPIATFKLGQLLTKGTEDHNPHNWRLGFKWSRLYDAAGRHFEMWKAGMDLDPDTNQSNLSCVAFAIMGLLEFEETHPELDDRYKLPLDILYKLYPPKKNKELIKQIASGKFKGRKS